MLLAYYPPIRSHALHVYESAAVTMPECTLSRTINVDTAGAHLITARPGGWTATLQVLEGHTSCVVSVIFSPDGSQLASSSKDGTVRLWSARTGDQLAVFKSGSGSVASPVAFSPDGTRIMSGVFYDGTLRLWDTRTHDALPFLRSRRRNVDFVAFTPTDSPISVHDSTVCVWHLDASPKTRTVLKGHKHDITALAFSPDGCYIVSGSYDCMVRLWDFETGTLLATFRGHSGSVLSVSFSPVEDLLVSSSEDRTIRIWNTRIGEVMSVLRGHSQKVTSVAFSPHGRQVVSGSDDKTVRVWDVHSSEQLAVLQGHKSAVTSVLFSPNVAQNRVVSSSHDGTIRVWDMQMCSQSFEMPWSDDTNDRTISGVLSPDGACYVSTMREHARVWDVQTGKVIADLVGHTSCITSRDFSPNSLQFVSGSRDKTVRVWDTRSGHQLAALDRHQKGVKVVMFSPDGSRVVSGSDDHTARLWDVSSGEQLFVFSGHKGGVSCLTFSPDGLWVVSGSDADRDGTVIVWDVPTGSQVAILEGIIWLSQVVFSPDGTSLYVIQDDGDEIVCDFQHLVTSGCVPEARHAAEITDVESARTLDGQAFGRISWNRATGWISYTAGADPIPLCWLPVEQRGRDIICGWRIILDRGGIDENLTILDLTDAVERLRNEGLV
jgi:WD40 repeat protein